MLVHRKTATCVDIGRTKSHAGWVATYHESAGNTRLGSFTTKEEAALAYARYVGAEEAARLTAESTRPEYTFTAAQAIAQAKKEGLTLVPSSVARSESGFKNVIVREATRGKQRPFAATADDQRAINSLISNNGGTPKYR